MSEKSKAEALTDELFTHIAGEADYIRIFESHAGDKVLWWSKSAILAKLQSFEAEVRGEGWRDIASAPKDRSAILVFCPESGRDNDKIRLVYRFDGETKFRIYASGGRWLTETPTHWMPLPSPPKEQL